MSSQAMNRTATLLETMLARACVRRLRAGSAAQQTETATLEAYSSWRSQTLLHDLAEHFGDAPIAGARVLDFGCGRGELALAVAQAGARSVVGVDLKAQSVAYAREAAARSGVAAQVSFRVGEPRSIPVPSQSIDLIVCFDVMEHIIEYEAIIPEWRRVLVAGGRVLINWVLWTHPYGHHCYPLVNLPWVHLLVSDYTIMRVAERVYDSEAFQAQQASFWDATRAAERHGNPYAGETTQADYLNKLSPRRFEAVCRQAGLAIGRKEVVPFAGESARFLKRSLASIPIIRDGFCASVLYELVAA